MFSNFHITQCLVFISIVRKAVLAADNTTLKLINVVFRHGDRTPIPPYELYPNDPYKNYNFTPPGYGKLTKSGELREYNLGKFLRETYNDFLGINYISGAVAARSSNFNRTKESLKLVLKGLYPGATIPINFKPILKDSLLLPQFCPRYMIEYTKATGESGVKQELAKLKVFKKNLSQWTGKTMKSARDMYFIYTTLESEKFMNLTLPSWTHGIFPNGDLLNATILQHKIMNYNEKLKRLNGGMFIRKFTEDMKSVRNGSMDKNRKIMLYSAHDVNVAAVLKALDVYPLHAPKFSSAAIVELHLIDEDFFVKVSYYLGVPAEIKELKIPGCKILCPLNQFIILMQNVIPTGVDLLCSKIRGVPDVEINSEEINKNRTKLREMFFSEYS